VSHPPSLLQLPAVADPEDPQRAATDMSLYVPLRSCHKRVNRFFFKV
jgi:hypothetical protein